MNGFNGYNNYNQAGYMPNAYNSYGYSQQMPQQDTSVSWVQGRSGAEAYPLAPGRRALLMDSNDAILYVKQTDSTGRYLPLQAYRLVPMEDISQNQALPPAEVSIDYDRIREIISEEVSKQYRSQRKEAK